MHHRQCSICRPKSHTWVLPRLPQQRHQVAVAAHQSTHPLMHKPNEAAHLWVLSSFPQQCHRVAVVAQRALSVALGAAAVAQAAAHGAQPADWQDGTAEWAEWAEGLMGRAVSVSPDS